MAEHWRDAREDVVEIYHSHSQETIRSTPHPDPILLLGDAILTLATVIHMQGKK